MNTDLIKQISNELNIKVSQIEATLKLLQEGATIPFIARYRKEATGALDEEQIRKISEVYEYQENLLKRKEDVIRLIDEKGLLTEELKNSIMLASKLVEVEDLYRPFKEKKKAKATDAINNGLEPLAKMIMAFPLQGDIQKLAGKFLNDNVKSLEEAVTGAKYIIAEYISDNAYYRKYIRNFIYRNGVLKTKKKKNDLDLEKVYEMYYDYQEPIKLIKSHRILAVNRAEKNEVLTVNLEIDNALIIEYLESKIIKNKDSFVLEIVSDAIKDAYKRLIFPSIEREIRSDLTEKAMEDAIVNFSNNLEKLLMQPPMKEKMVLGLDPAYRTGCKLAVIDKTGQKLEIKVIYPHEPRNEKEASKKVVLDLIDKYKIDIIAIGNGTASRESEAFIADLIKEAKRKVEYIIVSEAGASVYSASKLAIEEFPDLHVEERSAISIARRLQDPLAELVKIDPESIGVGLYQHDVQGKRLSESLDFVILKAVNSIGVNINTASPFLLKYISGLTKKTIDKIVEYRNKHGRISERSELKKQKILSDKVYEQAIGFLRITDGKNILDVTNIHPESYDVALKLLDHIGCTVADIGTEKIRNSLNLDLEKLKEELHVDIYTLEDIIKSFKMPIIDPRDDMPKPILRSDILHLEDLKVGMKLQGTVRNVVDFGAFVDIGLKNDGLVHISNITDQYIKHPSEVLNVGDIVDVYVKEILLDKKKVALSLKEI